MDPITEIKNRIPIEELVSQYVPLKKAGRQFKALCPFHNERTPSFYVSPERQLAYCFGCRKGGDHFKFIEEIEGLDFRGALQLLAEKAGVDLPKIAPVDKKKKSERDRLMEVHDYATRFFEEQLWDSSDGKKVLAYLKKRGLAEETIKHARLGFAVESYDALYSFLLKKDFTRDEIITSGLCVARDTEEKKCVDRFRTRLMFPIHNVSGNICAFGGRAVKDGDEPKYLNSPETPIFHKSSLLYGLIDARSAIRAKNCAIIVEGYMDALSVRQADFENVVACGGTALTEDQLVILKRFTKKIIFAFDRDTAGKLATKRAIELGFAQDFSISVAVWKSKAKDPDECVRDDPKLFAESLETAPAATKYLLNSVCEEYEIATPDGKNSAIAELLPFFAKLASPVSLDEWVKESAASLNISVTSLYDEVKRFQGKQKKFREQPQGEDFLPNKSKIIQIEEYLLGLLLTHKEFSVIANQLVQPEDFEDIELQNIYRSLGTQYNQMSSNPSEELENRIQILRMLGETKYADMDWIGAKGEVLETIRTLLRNKFAAQKRSLVLELKNAGDGEKTGVLEKYQQLLEKENTLSSETEILWQKN